MSDAWRAVLAADAEFVGTATRSAGLDKTLRQRARPLLAQAWAVLEPAEGDPDLPPPEPPTPEALLALVRQMQTLRADLGDAGAGVRRLREVLIRRPHPEKPRPILAARVTEATATRIDGHFRVPVALDRKRLEWFEERCKEQDPTRVAKVRAPEEKDNREPMELLHKKGSSRFS